MIKGPYILDPDAGFAVTSKDSETASQLVRGQRYGTVEVDDATVFPDADGWLVFGYGYDYEVGPVRYLGHVSPTELALDYSFKFTKTVPAGATVTLLKNKGPFVPERPEELGLFYVTASPAGRVAASAEVDAAVAAGNPVEKTITYPGDRGLGNEGYPAKGSNKLSDKVYVWAGNEVDAEVDAAREE